MMDRLPISLVVTSCGRFDLLSETLDSLFAIEKGGFQQIIITEDSAKPDVAAAIRERYPQAVVIFNDPQIGQMRSIDKAYAQVTQPYVFHCEDDWGFDGEPFLATCRDVLDRFAKISAVCVRRISDLPPRFQDKLSPLEPGKESVLLMPAGVHPEWFGYSFNPTLVRLETFNTYGPFTDHVSEEHLSYALKRDGFEMAYLDPGVAHHIGDERHVPDPTRKQRAKTPLQKLARSVNKRVLRIKRSFER